MCKQTHRHKHVSVRAIQYMCKHAIIKGTRTNTRVHTSSAYDWSVDNVIIEEKLTESEVKAEIFTERPTGMCQNFCCTLIALHIDLLPVCMPTHSTHDHFRRRSQETLA